MTFIKSQISLLITILILALCGHELYQLIFQPSELMRTTGIASISTVTEMIPNNTPTPEFQHHRKTTGIVILTTWRSGSTFFGDLLNSHPSTFLHYEPLLYVYMKQVRPNDQDASGAVDHIKSLLKCDFNSANSRFLAQISNNPKRYRYETSITNLPKSCIEDDKRSMSPCQEVIDSIQETCQKFPVQLIKTVRLRASLAREIVTDKGLEETKLILFIRDPRGTLESRHGVTWCKENRPDCSDPEKLCQDLVDDHDAAKILLQQFAENFMVLRYEDMMSNITKKTEKVFDFVGLRLDENVKAFIETHTVATGGGAFSTFRDSSKVPYLWKSNMAFEEAVTIQKHCSEAMSLWGYREFASESEMRDEDMSPVLPLKELVQLGVNGI